MSDEERIITRDHEEERYVLIWVNKRDFYGTQAVDSSDWFYASAEDIKYMEGVR